MLQIANVQKGYPGVVALNWTRDMSLTVEAGEIHGIVGENGAGKSTLLSVISGLQLLDNGSMRLGLADYAPRTVAAARRAGVEIVTQELGLVTSLSVTDNFFLGRDEEGFISPGPLSRRAIVRKALSTIAPEVSPRALAGSLTLQQQKLVELARAVHFGGHVLLIDEISASLDRVGMQRFSSVIRAAKKDQRAVLFISHYLE